MPTGPVESWSCDPFAAEIKENVITARGAADMKSSISAFLFALKDIDLSKNRKKISILLTSNEEGDAKDGTIEKVLDELKQNNNAINYCLAGEPSSKNELGDTVRIGRRGSFQISNINAGTGAKNVVPGDLKIEFNFRFSPEITEDEIKAEVVKVIEEHIKNYELDWELNAKPFYTDKPFLRNIVTKSIKRITGINTIEDTGGGTSDGRFMHPHGAEVVELGPINASIHKIDEHIKIDHLEVLKDIYRDILISYIES